MSNSGKLLGRPPLPEGEARTERVVAFLRPVDYRNLEARADKRGVPVGQIVRELLEDTLHRQRHHRFNRRTPRSTTLR